MLKDLEVTRDTLIKIVLEVDPKEAVDAEVAKIAKEKQSVPDGFGDAGGVQGRTSDDDDQEERAEV
jgi:hypothetical protein